MVISSDRIIQKPVEIKAFKQFRRPIREILADLAAPIPSRFIKSKTIGGRQLKFVSWYELNRLMDYFAPGFEFKIKTSFDGKRISTIGELTICAEEGNFTRSATGSENADVDSYGDPYSNSEAQAFRRCCAKFGLGLDMWG